MNVACEVLDFFGYVFSVAGGVLFAVGVFGIDKQNKYSSWLSKIYSTIDSTLWRNLPQRIISKLTGIQEDLADSITLSTYDDPVPPKKKFDGITIYLVLVVGVLSFWIRQKYGWASLIYWLIAYSCCYFGKTIINEIFHLMAYFKRTKKLRWSFAKIARYVYFALIAAFVLAMLYFILEIILSGNVYYKFAISLVTMPVVMMAFFLVPLLLFLAVLYIKYPVENNGLFKGISRKYKEDLENDMRKVMVPGFMVSFGAGIGIMLTNLGVMLGHIFGPQFPFAMTKQLIIVNLICDGLTFAITFIILKKVIMMDRIIILPFAIILDIAASAILAILSLYLSTVGTDMAFSLKQCYLMLGALNEWGECCNFGSYFWVMHTSFIPTMIYLAIISLALIIKVVLVPMHWFFDKNYHVEKPYNTTSAAFIPIGMILLAVSHYLSKLVE